MKKWMIVSIVSVLALGLGVGGAFLYKSLKPASISAGIDQQYDSTLPQYRYWRGGPGRMMGPWFEWRGQNRAPGQVPQQDEDDGSLK